MIIADRDRSYIESFAQYVRNSEFASRFDLKLFSKQEALEQFFSNGELIDILLASPDMLPEEPMAKAIDLTIQLTESSADDELEYYLRKYQPLGQIMTEVLRFYYEKDGSNPKKKLTNVSTKVLSTYSASGGTGKTVVAYAIAKQLANQGHSVLYLNLELINSSPLLFDTKNKLTASPLLYYIKTDAEILDEQIDKYTITDGSTGIDYFNFVPSAEEMEEFEADSVERLIQTIIEINKYSYLILDLDSTISLRSLKGLNLSDHIYWLLNNDMYSFHKTSYLFEDLHRQLNDASLKDRVTFVLNRYTGAVDSRLEAFNINIEAYLPYVPEWKTLVNSEQIDSVPIFMQHTLELLNNRMIVEQGVNANDS